MVQFMMKRVFPSEVEGYRYIIKVSNAANSGVRAVIQKKWWIFWFDADNRWFGDSHGIELEAKLAGAHRWAHEWIRKQDAHIKRAKEILGDSNWIVLDYLKNLKGKL